MKLKTINLIEEFDSCLTVHSFSNDKQGTNQAKRLFFRIAREQEADNVTGQYFTDNEIKEGWETATIFDNNGWKLAVHWSE